MIGQLSRADPGRGQAPGRRDARAVQPDRRGGARGQDVLGRHAAAAGPGRQLDRVPAVLFLDEPTTGLDPNARAMTWDIVRELADSGTTLLLTTQYLEEADQLAGRIAVIDGGAVIAEGTPDQLKSSLGGEHLEIALAAGADIEAAIVAVKPFATGGIQRGRGGAAPVGAGRRRRGADHAGRAGPGPGRGPGQRRHHPSARRSTTCSWPSPDIRPATTTRRPHDRHHR